MTSDGVDETLLAERLTLPEFPRSAAYPPRWGLEHLMGPNVLWLAESLSQVMDLRPGMRVLDMGCGRAISSIFLAREFGVQVWATDLWIGATENWARIQTEGLAERVFPIHAEAHALPFADGFFDAAVSLDAYQYFGTDDLYLAPFSRLVKLGGEIGIVCPGLVAELEDTPPEHLARYWQDDYWCFHSPAWWRRHWTRSGAVAVEHADLIPDGWRHWLHWDEVAEAHRYTSSEDVQEMLRSDAGRTLGFARVVARVTRRTGLS